LNEQTLASGSKDKQIFVWNLITNSILTILSLHKGSVNSIVTLDNNNNNKLVSCSNDKLIIIWKQQIPILMLKGHADKIKCLVRLPDNNSIASGSKDKTIKIWNINTGQLLATLLGHNDKIRCLTVLPNGNLASGSADKNIRIWNVFNKELVQMLTGNAKSIRSLTVLNENILVSSSEENDILKLWNLNKGLWIKNLKILDIGSFSSLTSIKSSSLDNRLICSADNTIIIWK
jgi:WD40 repeat protein